MNSLVNANFNRTYNPSGSQNALSDIKRLLTSRDTAVQIKACEYVLSAICRHNVTSSERDATVGYLLDNDITVFLCEATSNLDLSLFRLILSLLRLLWRQSRFFYEEHAAQAMTAMLRALAHYGNSGSYGAVDCCLHFLCDLLSGVSAYQTTAPLSHQSAYSADQLLACLLTLAPRITTRRKTVLSSALVLHSLISYQPEGMKIKGGTVAVLAQVLAEWFGLLVGALKHSALIGDDEDGGFYAVTCQLGMDALRLVKLLRNGIQEEGLVQSILADAQEMRAQTDSGDALLRAAHGVMVELVGFTKENQHIVPTQEYGGFLKFLLTFLLGQPSGLLPDFCDMLFSAGYLKMLPQAQIMRKDVTVRNVSTLVLGELLKVLSQKHLGVGDADLGDEKCSREIQMGLIELQNGIERPQTIGLQLKQCQPYSLLIYIYFYSQSSDNPEEATAPLLPFLVEHILHLPKGFRPPNYIIKALWLVLAMSTVSSGTPPSLDDRVRLERATDRFVGLLQPDPSVHYTHNPAILLWCFTSSRMVNSVRVEVLSQWLRLEDTLPIELSDQPITWDLLLKVLYQSRDRTVLYNTVKTLNVSLSSCEETDRQQVASVLWSMLPGVLSSVLIDWDFETETNVCYILELSTTLIPTNVDPSLIVKVAVLLSTIFSKTSSEQSGDRYDYECVCLKLSLYILGLSYSQDDNRVLLTYINRPGFLPRVLSATTSVDDKVACAALQLLSYVVHYFVKSKYQPKVILEVETTSILKSLREDNSNDRGSSLLQLIYMILYSGVNTPLVLSYNIPELVDVEHQYTALKALMFRVQMLCCKESTSQSSAAWKTLSSIFKHAIVTKNDTKLIEKLTTQLWLHTLINFTITHFTITEEFLTFLNNWLTLLKITNKSKQKRVYQNSMFSKTTQILRKHLAETDEEDELKELKRKVLVTVLEASNLNECYSYDRRYLSHRSLR